MSEQTTSQDIVNELVVIPTAEHNQQCGSLLVTLDGLLYLGADRTTGMAVSDVALTADTVERVQLIQTLF